MPITADSVDYTGRTLDICVLGNVDGLTPGIQSDSLTFGKPSQYVAGIQKLIQRYTICLLTILGSQSSYPDFGTAFLSSLQNNAKITQTAATHIFNFANLIIINQFRAYQAATQGLPLDEQLNTASLLSFVTSGANISFQISILSNAGSSVTFLVPLPQRNS